MDESESEAGPRHTTGEAVHQGALSLSSSADFLVGHAILSYLHLARSMIAQGVPLSQVFGPDNPNMLLLFRHRVPSDDNSAELSAKVAMADLPIRVATAVIFTYFLRVCDIRNGATASLTSCGSV